jgi:hypothetical protein
MPGHPILTPEDCEIEVPSFAFPKLKRLKVLSWDRELRIHRISSRIYSYLKPGLETLADGLQRLLGRDCSGPTDFVVCRCDRCMEIYEPAKKGEGRI